MNRYACVQPLMVMGLLAMHSNTVAAAEPSGTVRLGDDRFMVRIAVDSPDAIDAHGPRFDQTALVRQVTLDGHTFLAEPWGLIDEFGITGVGVLGFDDAASGESFIKIGVGVLTRDDDKPYRFYHPYPLREGAAVTMLSRDDRSLVVTQSAKLGGWGYRYIKRYDIAAAAATLRITYDLTNTGDHPLVFDHYNHNWFRFDSAATDSGYLVTAAFTVEGDPQPWLTRRGGELAIAQPPQKGGYFLSSAKGPASVNRVTLRHELGSAVMIGGDFDVDRFALYADAQGVCPEVFYASPMLTPGQTAAWVRTYRFDVGSPSP